MDLNILREFGLTRVRLVPTSFLRVLQLTALLVAEFEADPQFSHAATRKNVGDPLDHKRIGLLRIRQARSWKDFTRVEHYSRDDLHPGSVATNEHRHLPTLRKVRSSIGRMGRERSVLSPSGGSG